MMFEFQQFILPSCGIPPYQPTTGTSASQEMVSIEKRRERSLSPDSLEQRFMKHHVATDGIDDDESFSSSSSSLIDSITSEQYHDPTVAIFKTLTTRNFFNGRSCYFDHNDDDIDDDLDEIHLDQDEVNLLLSDPDDAGLGRLPSELLDLDDDYDDDDNDFCVHIRPLPLMAATDFIVSSSSSSPQQQQQQQQNSHAILNNYHLLDTISEAASEEERRAAISIIRQKQKHKHSSISSSSLSPNGLDDDDDDGNDTTTNDDLSTLSDMDDTSASLRSFSPRDRYQSIRKKRRHGEFHLVTLTGAAVDAAGESGDTLERLRNISKMFNTTKGDGDQQQLQKVEKLQPGERIKNTFQKFEEGVPANELDDDQEENEEQTTESNGVIRSTKKKAKALKEHIPYHEMAEVKDKFEKGTVDADKPRVEKRLDVRVQSGLASSKKQAFEHGEFEQETESHVNKVQIDTDLVAGLASDKKSKFEKGEFEQQVEPHGSKVQIETDLVGCLASAKKQAYEQHQLENESTTGTKTVIVDRDAMAGAATEKKAKFEKGEFDHDYHDYGANRVQVDADLLAGAATENKAKFESGQAADRATTPTRRDDVIAMVEAGNAQAKRSELMSKIEAEQQVQRSGDRHIDIDPEQGLATARREQLASLASAEYKGASGTASGAPVVVESGLAKSRATAFENPDETTVKRTVEIDNELLERGVAKERVAMFKNLESGTQPSGTASINSGDSKLRVDENGNVVRESDKREEVYFEKGQTRQLVEQWKTKQISPDRDTPDAQVIRDAEILQQGKAKDLVEMWKTMDKENTPPPERRGPRAITPPTANNERRLPSVQDDEPASRQPGYADDKANIESGHAKAVRERLMQNVEQNSTTNTRKSLKQVTPPLEGSERRKSTTPPDTSSSSSGVTDQYANNEEIVPTKGQAQSLKNRFVEMEKDAMKVETASSKIKHVPKRFVDTPAPKQTNVESTVDNTKCFSCNKTVYAMEKIEADKKIFHKSCFKCMHCKSILKLGNYTANDGQIYCKPHFLQLFAIKGNYSAGFGLSDHKARWLPSSNVSSTPTPPQQQQLQSTSSNES